MKKCITVYEQEMKTGEKTVLYKVGVIRENFITSVLSDTFTFGILIFSFYINHQFIGSRILSSILLVCFLFTLWNGTVTKKVSKEDFIKIMEEHLKD